MELKNYQKDVIDDLQAYLDLLNSNQSDSLSTVFARYWREHRRFPIPNPPTYHNTIPGVPNVCVKVPTAGGKTFIAVNALQPIFDAKNYGGKNNPKMVVWLVPSESILSQTLKNLRDIQHPYRQKLNAQFGGVGRVQIFNKEEVLRGQNFDADSVHQGISIVVMSFDSLKGRSKEVLRAYRDNANLAGFEHINPQDKLEEFDETSLINVVRSLNPVLIVDESHHTATALSKEMLVNLNPSFILELTATPKATSNIISYVDAVALKAEQMVKLPVIVSKQNTQTDVMMSALTLRANLEKIAENAFKSGASPYIRPIVLFQAEPKSKEDNATFEHIKNELLKINIPENQIAIKTSEINELKNVDLLSKDCPIRFVITVNALKEGWDCPYAYILASLANKSSVVDVTQIVGRVLRQPYAQNHTSPLLNSSFVFTSSDKFDATLQSIVKGLNMAGFSEHDYRLAIPTEMPASSGLPETPKPSDDLFGQTHTENLDTGKKDEATPDEKASLPDDFRPSENTGDGDSADSKHSLVVQTVADFQKQAEQQSRDYQELAVQNPNPVPPDLQGKTNMTKIQNEYVDLIGNLKLPQFFIKADLEDWFSENGGQVLLDKANLLKNLKLSGENCNIDFGNISETVYQSNIDDKGMVQFQPLKGQDKKRLVEIFANYPDKTQQETLIRNLFDLGKKSFYPIGDDDIKAYFRRIVEQMNSEQRQHCFIHIHQYFQKIKQKINQISTTFAEEEFYKQRDIDEIVIAPHFSFPSEINPSEFGTPYTHSLYEKEGKISDFESRILQTILNHDDIDLTFWHRNLEKSGFCINAFLNHYPDFVLLTKKGTVVLLETKGNQLDGSDSQAKIRAGKAWENAANQLNDGWRYKYLMVFETGKLDGSYSVEQMLDKLKNW